MGDEKADNPDIVTISVEISGEYGDVISKLRDEDDTDDSLSPLISDIESLLQTIDRSGGGTRSAIADRLSSETACSLDAEAVVDICRVLERYGFVVLEDNTWKPGPNLEQ